MESTKQQRMMIATTGRRVFGSEENYRNWLMKRYGADSPRLISKAEASDCIDMLKRMESGKPLPPKKRGYLWATEAQLTKILALCAMAQYDDEKLVSFIVRQTDRLKTIHMLTRGEATKVIIGLQKIISKGDKAKYAWLNQYSGDQLSEKVKSPRYSELREVNEA